MHIPFADLKSQNQMVLEEFHNYIDEIVSSSQYIRGEFVELFESAFAQLLNVKHVRGVASGTDALVIAVEALGLSAGDEVITVANTYISTAFSISRCGARVKFADIDPNSFQVDPKSIEKQITENTKAIIAVHMFGHPAPMREIINICQKNNLFLIEDVAQSPLATIDDKYVGSFGDISCYSFYPSKNLGAIGDAGAITTNNDVFSEKIKQLSNYGQSETYIHVDIGNNSRLDTIQAGVLLLKLPYLKEWNQARRKIADNYKKLLTGIPVKLLKEQAGCSSVYHLFPIMVDNRDEVIKFLNDNGVMSQIHYPNPIHLQPCYEYLGYKKGDLPVIEAFCASTLSLPIYPHMTEREQKYICQILSDAIR